MGSTFSTPISSKIPNQVLSFMGPSPRRRLQKKNYCYNTGDSRGSVENRPCDTRLNFLQLQLQVEEPTRPQSPSPSARSIPGLRRFGIGSLRSVTKGRLRVVNASRPPTAISMDQCPMSSEWFPENDYRNVLNAAFDLHAESTEWVIPPDLLQSYEEASGRNSISSLTAMSCDESEDVRHDKISEEMMFLQKAPETYHRNVGERQHAPEEETETSLCSLRPRLLLRLRGILRIFF